MTGCATMGGPVRGKVLDEATSEPIEGAIVVARWTGHLAGWADGKTVCYYAESTVTDSSGNYYLPRWRDTNTEAWQRKVKPEDVYITAYKSGYVWSEKREKGIKFLKIFDGAKSTRLKQLKQLKRIEFSTRCNVETEHLKVRSLLISELYKEAKEIASTKEDRRIVDSLLYILESMENGDDQALENLIERRKSRGE